MLKVSAGMQLDNLGSEYCVKELCPLLPLEAALKFRPSTLVSAWATLQPCLCLAMQPAELAPTSAPAPLAQLPTLTWDLPHHRGLAWWALSCWLALGTGTRLALLLLLGCYRIAPLLIRSLSCACLAVMLASWFAFLYGAAGMAHTVKI